MAGSGEPPEGTPDSVPGGGEEEYRSVVFDESFVRAARIQEFSAHERVDEHTPAVRSRPAAAVVKNFSRQAMILVVLIAIAFGTAIYMGVRHPYEQPSAGRPAEPLRSTVIPLVPKGAVPGAKDPEKLFANSPAAQFKQGAAGISLPAVRATAHFSESQVLTALTTAKDYLVESSLDHDVLNGHTVRPVRILLDPDQLDQFDASFARPVADGRHAATGWLVRFDPGQAALADSGIRVRGSMHVGEANDRTLEVTSEHTFVYALREPGSDEGRSSLFTVRRELHFRFDQTDLRMHRAELLVSYLQAGPLACAADSVGRLRPLLAGQKAEVGGPAGTDPYAPDSATALCGSLDPSAQPKPPRSSS
ncbi:hypothetical protein DY218_09300 [Streptomyces triticagri]|uniref:Uncharacterized protein n=1 Tax=Streptomyces triticagri TaxID=2293568 RepID=A0A372M927_9ACTN|nr:hypothetical protein [Streptomyces triticagri]RFU87015.1 hypothetical protein DY218_09300 [Streptomyces triticagri]